MTTTEVMHEVNLIDGKFTPSEASDLINSFLKEKINFHKLHRLSLCEGNTGSDTSFDDSRVSQLERELIHFKALCHEARAAGKQFRIKGILDVEIID